MLHDGILYSVSRSISPSAARSASKGGPCWRCGLRFKTTSTRLLRRIEFVALDVPRRKDFIAVVYVDVMRQHAAVHLLVVAEIQLAGVFFAVDGYLAAEQPVVLGREIPLAGEPGKV